MKALTGMFSQWRYCPRCGTETLVRDEYQGDRSRARPEYRCTECRVGFVAFASYRMQAEVAAARAVIRESEEAASER